MIAKDLILIMNKKNENFQKIGETLDYQNSGLVYIADLFDEMEFLGIRISRHDQ